MDLRHLPSVDALAASLREDVDLPYPVVADACRTAIDITRTRLQAGEDLDAEQTARSMLSDVSAARPATVINATGVLLHTNLGRAAVPDEAAEAALRVSAAASNVEIDVRTGRRSKRHTYLGSLLPLVSGAEAGFAVNNNAGALLLALASSAGRGGRVAVSRGELIEIGGSFRLPDLMEASGVELVEVGTTNRTRLSDYQAVANSVDVLLKVHPSNYRIEGFSEQATHAELAELSREADVPFIADVGSGLIDELAPWMGERSLSWLAGEPGVRQTVHDGADLVLFSGDKLMGGPQAGIIVGTAEAVTKAAKHPLARALRLDGGSIAALAATLEMYLEQRVQEIPFWAMAMATVVDIEARSLAVIKGHPSASIVDGASVPGAGSVPGETIPTKLVKLTGSADELWTDLATATVPVIGTRRDGSVFLDLRSVRPDDDRHVSAAIATATP